MLGKLSCNVGQTFPTLNVMSSTTTETHWQQFGKWLKTKRIEAKLTQVQVANKAGITDVQYARIEKGESGTKRETVIELAKAIGSNLIETLNKAGFDIPKEDQILPHQLKVMDFDGFDEDDLKEIADFINFKRSQKQKAKVND